MRKVLLVILTSMTAACGGGGTNSAGSMPPLPPAPQTPTEVARQVPVNSSFDALTVAETFNTVASTARANLDANGAVTGIATTQAGFKSDVTIAYNPANQSYTVSTARGGINNQTTFTSADSDSSPAGILTYSKSISPTEGAQLLLTKPSGLHYSALGTWTDGSESSSGALVQASIFAFGQETAFVSLPKTGSATYQLLVAGIGREGAVPYGIGGVGTASVNFSNASLAADLRAGLYDGNGNIVSTQTLTGTATIASDFARFAGSLQGTVNGTPVTGPMNGAFFGPAAEEIGGSFKVTGGQFEAVGGFVGVK
ncbi:transferrin-binding protein-like solute binding protein [Sphingomonas sp.]|uniref:transferrin-binding protein-like solute binding protein n=1 Tax=Sphingomonas sp. TaxID=28214 RepID=UPI0025E5BDCB|nr:transferrin-binding protein-like solute binding protein [Sphingomonas sp.]